MISFNCTVILHYCRYSSMNNLKSYIHYSPHLGVARATYKNEYQSLITVHLLIQSSHSIKERPTLHD